ncbi:FxsA family protein [Halomonas piscis]|uniref:FxsA family protein n=1 Tax=Halomonas piscis TaxID=3031727 RepID=A0ABY9YY79_9GAMM|nr:FxsA family protein [Halomonas piscis]WNK19039.1 FxsA family protein [Halomonas piscis]
MPILLFITLFTLLDFVVLFSIGGQIGLLATLALVLITGIGGLHLIRRQGAYTFARAQARFSAGELPSSELATGAALIFGGALLMAPGFLSDALGLACLIPDARRLLLRLLTWLGFRASVAGYQQERPPFHTRRQAGDPGDWNNARPRHRQKDSTSRDDPRQKKDDPLEGEFIARDEASRRR